MKTVTLIYKKTVNGCQNCPHVKPSLPQPICFHADALKEDRVSLGLENYHKLTDSCPLVIREFLGEPNEFDPYYNCCG